MKITTHTKKWTNTVATIVIGTTMFFGIKQAHKEYELLNPIIKIFTENPSQKFSEIYLSFKKERLDQEKKQNLEEFIKKNKEKIDLYRSELENITNISEEKNYSEKILRYIENQSKFSNVLKEYYKDTTTTGFSDKLINSKEDYYNLSKQILKNLNKKFR
ncbi:hypothetical protein K9K83_06090, partial [Candidatus Woesearchaeota archaeon]|nr:hypothetical protein [Candidatus Woesearchaeota archaeon]